MLALDGLWVNNWARERGLHGLHVLEWGTVTVLCALIFFSALWLLFGVRSRIMAMFGTAQAAGLVFWFHGLGLTTDFQVMLFLAAFLAAAPLMWLGGGHFSIYRRGWRTLT